MKKTLYSKEFLKMQKLAGVITEGQYKTLIKENYSYGDKVSYNGKDYVVVASSEDNDLMMTDKLKQKLADSGTDESNFVVIEKDGPNRTDNLATDQLLGGGWTIVDKNELSSINESFQKGDDIGFHLLNYLEDRTSVGDKEAEEIYNANFAGDEEKEIEYKDSNDLTPEDIAILKTYVEKKAKEGDKAALKLMSDMESNS